MAKRVEFANWLLLRSKFLPFHFYLTTMKLTTLSFYTVVVFFIFVYSCCLLSVCRTETGIAISKSNEKQLYLFKIRQQFNLSSKIFKWKTVQTSLIVRSYKNWSSKWLYTFSIQLSNSQKSIVIECELNRYWNVVYKYKTQRMTNWTFVVIYFNQTKERKKWMNSIIGM